MSGAVHTAQSAGVLARPLASLWGVGPERAAQLARLGLHTVEDLLLHRPRRYEDRRHARPIAHLPLDEPATTRGTVVALGVKRFRKGGKSVFELILEDGSGRLHCRWWNLPFMENYFAVGNEVFVHGKVHTLRPRTMDHPETEVIEGDSDNFIHVNRIVPIYPLTEGLPQRWLRGLIWRTVEQCAAEFDRRTPRLDAPGRPSLAQAVRALHFPAEETDIEPARQRLALEEFFALQCELRRRRLRFEARAPALPAAGTNQLIRPFLARLGFTLTPAQTRVLREIRRDMGGAHPMRRLLQGDVGSGKTVVAACTALMALESGLAVALMAPTEVLAEQHFRTFQTWFAPLGVRVELLTGSRKTLEPAKPGQGAAGQSPRLPFADSPTHPALFIGTHALLESDFAPENLGLVIIDEQHKFGVAQRERLVRKGRYPHLLVMTATPIPRTLGLTLYGDLDVSVIAEMPPGRGRVKTHVRSSDRLPQVWAFVREQLAAGRQAYVVYPRVEEADTATGLKAVKQEFTKLQTTLAPFRVGLLHGRLSGTEKERVMAAFRAQTLHVLVATALIEVGVDVPNATIMVIENADRFGLAQLHQLRGRIGRGAHESHCILISDSDNPMARERLRVLEQTNDGFAIADADLRLRGPGELLGREQSGMPRFRFGDLTRDLDLIREARDLAAQHVARDDGAP